MGRKIGRRKKRSKKSPTEQAIVLDQFSALDVRHASAYRDKYLKFHWEYYSVLAYQRAKIKDQLQAALSQSTVRYSVDGWQRAVRWKYSNHPLCTRGSTIDAGGRFNIPDIDSTKFSIFPALYIAENKETALLEMLGQDVKFENSTMSRLDLALALAKETSITCVQVNAEIETVLDLTSSSCLNEFVDLIKDFKIPSSLVRAAQELKLNYPVGTVQNPEQLLLTLHAPEWRVAPMQHDIPANSQLFGQIALNAGIEAILYPSKMNDKKCLAIFIQNFENTSSFVQIIDTPPSPEVPKQIDASSWRKFL